MGLMDPTVMYSTLRAPPGGLTTPNRHISVMVIDEESATFKNSSFGKLYEIATATSVAITWPYKKLRGWLPIKSGLGNMMQAVAPKLA